MRVCDSTLKNAREITFLFMLNSCNNYLDEYDEVGAINKTEQISDFLDASSSVSLFSETK